MQRLGCGKSSELKRKTKVESLSVILSLFSPPARVRHTFSGRSPVRERYGEYRGESYLLHFLLYLHVCVFFSRSPLGPEEEPRRAKTKTNCQNLKLREKGTEIMKRPVHSPVFLGGPAPVRTGGVK